MSTMIQCQTFYGKTIKLPRERFQMRVSAYGVIFHPKKKAVLIVDLSNGKWALPGGGIEPCEAPAEALVREVHEETGVHLWEHTIQPRGFEHRNFYYDPEDAALSAVNLFFSAKASSSALAEGAQIKDAAVVASRWVDFEAIPNSLDSFQRQDTVLQIIKCMKYYKEHSYSYHR